MVQLPTHTRLQDPKRRGRVEAEQAEEPEDVLTLPCLKLLVGVEESLDQCAVKVSLFHVMVLSRRLPG